MGLDTPDRIIKFNELQTDDPWFFIGDIHGDPNCLNWALNYLKQVEGFRICLLGDIFGRGSKDFECFKMILNFANTHPQQVLWISGNHDGPLEKPSYETQWTTEYIEIRNELMPRLPIMACLPHGIMMIHGGPVPTGSKERDQTDQTIQQVLERSRYCRFSTLQHSDEDARHEQWFDAKDVREFGKVLKLNEGFHTLIRGHDHPEDGYHLHSDPAGTTVLTLLGSSRLGVEYMPNEHRRWTTLARLDASGQISVHRLFSNGESKQVAAV